MVNSEISCSDCQSACCKKGQTFTLNGAEVQFLRDGGSTFTQKGIASDRRFFHRSDAAEFRPIQNLPEEYYLGDHTLTSEYCGFVIEKDGASRCSAYTDPRRPEVCSNFELGGSKCLYTREFGIAKRKTQLENISEVFRDIFFEPYKVLGRLFAILNK